MKKHLFAVLALAAVAGAGLFALAADPPSENKAPPQDSKAAAEEPNGNTGEATTQPSAGVDGNAEFNEPSRSPAEMYARMDPAFSKYVDLSLLAQAMAGPDASSLADVALALAEGERVLVRNHRSGLNSEDLMARAVKLAARTSDKATLERIAKASTSLSKPQWSKLVTEAKEFAGVSRDGPMVALGKVDVSTVALMERVREACDVAELTGQKGELQELKKEVSVSEVEGKIKAHANDLIDNTLKGLPEKPDETAELLKEFSASSRRFETNKWDRKRAIEAGGWTVAWGREVTETDLIRGVIQVAVSTYLMGPVGGEKAFSEWIAQIALESVTVLGDSIRREFTAAARNEAQRFAQNVIKDLLNRRNPGEQFRRYGRLEFKAGVAEYNGRNRQWIPNFSREGGYWKTISTTVAFQPYVAVRIADGGAAGGIQGGGRVQRVLARNNTSQPIWVAAHYQLNGQWQTGGFWQLQPGQTTHIVNTTNRWVYFYANGPQRRPVWSGTDTYQIVRGERYGFKKADTGTGFGDFTYNFNP